MREQPWNVRRATTEHHQWYRNLIDLHALTAAWLSELNVARPPHVLKRTMDEDLSETLWMLEGLVNETQTPRGLEPLLDDTTPEDLLNRLERTVWVVQAWTLGGILERADRLSSAEDRSSLIQQLEQISWRAGRECAMRRWPDLGDEARMDLRGVFSAFRDCPLSGPAGRPAWLVCRSLPAELQLQLLECPHNSPHAEVAAVAGKLCPLHTHWMRGYAYAINTRITIETPGEPASPAHSGRERCRQQWRLALPGE